MGHRNKSHISKNFSAKRLLLEHEFEFIIRKISVSIGAVTENPNEQHEDSEFDEVERLSTRMP